MDKLTQTFDNITTDKHLLIANGFTLKYFSEAFSFKELYQNSELEKDPLCRTLIATQADFDFEKLINTLSIAATVANAAQQPTLATEWSRKAMFVQNALIKVIHQMHPESLAEIEDRARSAYEFISRFKNKFTLNYDLFLYWTLSVGEFKNASDGFGLESDGPNWRVFSPKAHCDTFYLHGALHLFPDEKVGVRKRLAAWPSIVASIDTAITTEGLLPLFVAEGTSKNKLAKIRSNAYLRHCYDMLRGLTGTLFIVGHSADETDEHIYNAICQSELQSVYFVCREHSQRVPYYSERMAAYKQRSLECGKPKKFECISND